jgi:hypothetical protein
VSVIFRCFGFEPAKAVAMASCVDDPRIAARIVTYKRCRV